MPQTQNSDDDQLPSNDPELTDAEIAAMEGFDRDGNEVDAITDAPQAEAGAADAPETPATDAPQAVEPTPAVAPPPPTAHSPIFTPAISPGEARDFAGEVKALKERYENGEIEDDEYEDARESIIEARTLYNAQASISAQLEEQAWGANVKAFLDMPENASLLRSPEMNDLWQAMMNRAVGEAQADGRVLADWAILTEGRDRLFQTLGISNAPVPAAPEAAPPPPRPNQAPNLSNVPPSLTNAPAAAPSGAKTTAESLAGADSILEIEQFMATQSEDQADALLRSLPGAWAE